MKTMKVRLIKILDKREGTSAAGNDWINVQFLVEDIQRDKNKDVALKAFGDNAKKILDMPVGQEFEVGVRLDSREYNGKWYTDPMVQDIYNIDREVPPAPAPVNTPAEPVERDNDLPF